MVILLTFTVAIKVAEPFTGKLLRVNCLELRDKFEKLFPDIGTIVPLSVTSEYLSSSNESKDWLGGKVGVIKTPEVIVPLNCLLILIWDAERSTSEILSLGKTVYKVSSWEFWYLVSNIARFDKLWADVGNLPSTTPAIVETPVTIISFALADKILA